MNHQHEGIAGKAPMNSSSLHAGTVAACLSRGCVDRPRGLPDRWRLRARAAAWSALLAGLVLLPVAASHAQSAWPAHPVKIIATSPPGGSVDLMARIVAEGFSQKFGQPFVVENRPGANGNIGVEAVVRAPADGQMLFVTTPGVFSINMYLQARMPFDARTEIAPIAMVGYSPLVLLVNPDVPARNLLELLAWLRERPGKVSYSSAGVGTTGHLGMELLRSLTGVDIVHVPYKGAAGAITDLLSGNVALTLNNTSASVPYIQKGQLRALGVAERHRLASLPELPTLAEAGVPGFEVTPWFGLGTRAGVAPDIIERMAAEASSIMSRPATLARLARIGMEPRTLTGAAFARYIRAESEKWSDIVRRSGARAE
jgi:tripartite-type tricarboxylate transporter receptor subunit TctC